MAIRLRTRPTSGELRHCRSVPSGLSADPHTRTGSQSYIFSACVSAIVAGYLAKVTKRYKWVGIAGVLVHIVGVWLMMRSRDLDAPTWELALSQVIGGIGGGFTTIAVQTGCQSVVGHQGGLSRPD